MLIVKPLLHACYLLRLLETSNQNSCNEVIPVVPAATLWLYNLVAIQRMTLLPFVGNRIKLTGPPPLRTSARTTERVRFMHHSKCGSAGLVLVSLLYLTSKWPGPIRHRLLEENNNLGRIRPRCVGNQCRWQVFLLREHHSWSTWAQSVGQQAVIISGAAEIGPALSWYSTVGVVRTICTSSVDIKSRYLQKNAVGHHHGFG